jgi:hypothetical protein
MDGIAEVRPVFDRVPRSLEDWRRVRAIGASVAMALPLTLGVTLWSERPVARRRLMLAGYSAVLALATILQTRFGRPLVSMLAVSAALALAAVLGRIAGRSPRRLSALLVAATSLYSATVWTQTQPTPAPAPSTHDRVEAAHEGLRGDDKTRDTARLTAAVARPVDPAAAARPVPRRNYIDTLIFDRLAKAGVPHAPLAGDDEFVRRVYLDVTGLPPSSADVRAFAADRAADKRDRLIDRLLASDEFAEQWAWHWGDLLRMSGEAGPGANAFHYWFKELLKVDRPYDRFVHDVLTPSSKVHATIPSLAVIGRSNQLKSRFVESPQVDAASISVETLNGTVMLSGFAKSTTEKAAAEELARSVNGVKSIKNEIAVRP